MAKLGEKMSEETKRKLSIAHTGKVLSEQHKQKLKENNAKHWLGKKRSQESIQKTSKGLLGHIPWNKGKCWSDEIKKKLSLAHTGIPSKSTTKFKKGHVPWSKGKKGAITAWNKGKTGFKHSEATRKKMSASHKGKGSPWNVGEKSVNWNGGSSFEPYTVDWKSSLKVAIRERDKYTCRVCGNKQSDIVHHVHHIDYDKKNCNHGNLITLCVRCHGKTNHNREYWMKFLSSLSGDSAYTNIVASQ